MIGRVPDQFGFGNANVGNRSAIVTPRRTGIGAGIAGKLPRRAGLRIALCRNDPDVGIVVTVGLFAPVAAECNCAAIGAPGRLHIIEVAECQLQWFRFAPADQVQMIAAPIQVRYAVTFELQPVDHERQRFCFFARLFRRLFGQISGRFVLDNQQHFLAVGCPQEIRYALVYVGVLLCITAAKIQRPDLGLRILLFSLCGEKTQEPPVRAPARR